MAQVDEAYSFPNSCRLLNIDLIQESIRLCYSHMIGNDLHPVNTCNLGRVNDRLSLQHICMRRNWNDHLISITEHLQPIKKEPHDLFRIESTLIAISLEQAFFCVFVEVVFDILFFNVDLKAVLETKESLEIIVRIFNIPFLLKLSLQTCHSFFKLLIVVVSYNCMHTSILGLR